MAKYFWVLQKYLTPLIPNCSYAKSTPWDVLVVDILRNVPVAKAAILIKNILFLTRKHLLQWDKKLNFLC